MHGTFVWNELASTDVEAAKFFYAEVLGWTYEEFPLPDGPYWVARAGERLVGGVGGLETGAIPSASSYWFAFIEVDELDARVQRALELGAALIQTPIDVPGVGRVAVLRDPTGAAIGWLSPPAEPADERPPGVD